MVDYVQKKYILQWTIVNTFPALFSYGMTGFISGIDVVSIVEIFVGFLYTLHYQYILPGPADFCFFCYDR